MLQMSMLHASMIHACTCKDKRNKPADKQRKKEGKQGKHAKHTLTSRNKRRQTKHAKHVKRENNMLSNKRGCPRRTNVGLNRVSIPSLDWSMDDTSKQRLMHEHVGKRAKRMHRSKESQTGGTK